MMNISALLRSAGARLVFCLALPGLIAPAFGAPEPIETRGYYMTFMRMPTFGLEAWKRIVDCLKDDGGDTLLLWTAGGFRSRRFPITWAYNRQHKNVEQDFVRQLIDYAHLKGVQVLLCVTPFAYDGVNQFALEHPELRARQKGGQVASFWGMHSWGYNLCPAKVEAQKFMFDYAREMVLDFYPNADGLMIESSDYAICYCADCQGKYFDREFEFVRKISDVLWAAKTNVTIVVYPHYFSPGPVPGFGVVGARHAFDSRWTLFFTPHSAHPDTNLIAQAHRSIYSDQGLSLGTPNSIRDAARLTRKYGITGYVPSLEPMTCPAGPPEKPGPLLKPFHFEWLSEGQMPLQELLIRVNRIAYREYTADPQLSNASFEAKLGFAIFGSSASRQSIADLVRLQETWFAEAEWLAPGPYVAPDRLRERALKEKWSPGRLEPYRQRVLSLRQIVRRHGQSENAAEREIARIAQLIVQKWETARMIDPE